MLTKQSYVAYATKSKAKKIPFTTKGRAEEGISADETTIYWQGEAILDDVMKLLFQVSII